MRRALIPLAAVLALGACANDSASFTCPGGGSGQLSTSRVFLTTAASIPVCGSTATITSDPNAAAMSAAADALTKVAGQLAGLATQLATAVATGGAGALPAALKAPGS